jgi:hypothetical protein
MVKFGSISATSISYCHHKNAASLRAFAETFGLKSSADAQRATIFLKGYIEAHSPDYYRKTHIAALSFYT